jgi:hypothetical protein
VCVCVCVCVCECARVRVRVCLFVYLYVRAHEQYLLAQYMISCEQGSESPSSIKARNLWLSGGFSTVEGATCTM